MNGFLFLKNHLQMSLRIDHLSCCHLKIRLIDHWGVWLLQSFILFLTKHFLFTELMSSNREERHQGRMLVDLDSEINFLDDLIHFNHQKEVMIIHPDLVTMILQITQTKMTMMDQLTYMANNLRVKTLEQLLMEFRFVEAKCHGKH